MEAYAAEKSIKTFAAQIGIDLIGFAPANFDKAGKKRLDRFIAEGRHATMSYLEDTEKRINPELLLPGAKTVIVIGINYYRGTEPVPKNHGKIARYAYGRDYHKTIKSLLKKLDQFIKKAHPAARTKMCVDSSPLLERSFAVQAGLGFIGKNTSLITKEFGSFVLLGEIITDLELEEGSPAAEITLASTTAQTPASTCVTPASATAQTPASICAIPAPVSTAGTCGTCTRCLDACPAKALISPYQLDARKCISYLTIENKGKIPREFHAALGNCLFGCDLCQEVCPYNKTFARPTSNPDLQKKIAGSSLPLREILTLKNDSQFLARFAGSPLMRAKRAGLQRNARVVCGNIG